MALFGKIKISVEPRANKTSKPAEPRSEAFVYRSWTWRKIAYAVIVVLIIAGISYFFYNKGKDSSKSSDQQLVAKVAKHALLPTDEQPIVYRITDPSKLKGQSFFSGAQKDDVVLAYQKSNRAIIYRPSIDRVIEAVLLPTNSSASPNGQ